MIMKKTYIVPRIKMMGIDTAQILNNSYSITGPEGTSYGGEDEDGSIDPSAKCFDPWDDEDVWKD